MITTSSHCLSFSSNRIYNPNFAALHRHSKYNCVSVAAFSSFASADTPKWDCRTASQSSNGNPNDLATAKKIKEGEEEEGAEVDRETEVVLGERAVKCEVEVLSWRERRIRAEIPVNADVESVWSALTDYERLADFIPNLVKR